MGQNWKPIDRVIEYGNQTEKVETSEFPNEAIKHFIHNCNLNTCRYNVDGKCTNEEKRKECVRVSKAVLCVDGKSISEFYAKMEFETMMQWKDRLSYTCDTNPNCECDPTNCGFAVEYSSFEDVSNGIHRYMCGRDKCKYSKGWKQIDRLVEYGENTEKIDVGEI